MLMLIRRSRLTSWDNTKTSKNPLFSLKLFHIRKNEWLWIGKTDSSQVEKEELSKNVETSLIMIIMILIVITSNNNNAKSNK